MSSFTESCGKVIVCCDQPTMCAQAGSFVSQIPCDITSILTPLAPSINKVIASSGQPSTASQIALLNAKNASTSSNLLIIGGIIILGLFVFLHK